MSGSEQDDHAAPSSVTNQQTAVGYASSDLLNWNQCKTSMGMSSMSLVPHVMSQTHLPLIFVAMTLMWQ